uniref:Uncharacterized protein n=1 Tax=Oryza meridionalis TaxID=40149 RepID=A0A0E0DGG8_9ORYZ
MHTAKHLDETTISSISHRLRRSLSLLIDFNHKDSSEQTMPNCCESCTKGKHIITLVNSSEQSSRGVLVNYTTHNGNARVLPGSGCDGTSTLSFSPIDQSTTSLTPPRDRSLNSSSPSCRCSRVGVPAPRPPQSVLCVPPGWVAIEFDRRHAACLPRTCAVVRAAVGVRGSNLLMPCRDL